MLESTSIEKKTMRILLVLFISIILGQTSCRKTVNSLPKAKKASISIPGVWKKLGKLFPDRPLTADDWDQVGEHIAVAAREFSTLGRNAKANDAAYPHSTSPYPGHTYTVTSNQRQTGFNLKPVSSNAKTSEKKVGRGPSIAYFMAQGFALWLLKQRESVKNVTPAASRGDRTYPYDDQMIVAFKMEGGSIEKKILEISFLGDYIFEYSGLRPYPSE